MGGLSRNQPDVRKVLEPYDAALFLGGDVLRMSVYSPVDPLPRGIAVLQIAERDWELGKNYPAEMALNTNVKETLRVLVPAVRRLRGAARTEEAARRVSALAANNWSARRAKLAADAEQAAGSRPIDPRILMLRIAGALPEDAVVVDEGTPPPSRSGLRALRQRPCALRHGERRHRLGYRGRVRSVVAAGLAGVRAHRRRQRDVRRAGPVTAARYKLRSLRDRQQPQLPHPKERLS